MADGPDIAEIAALMGDPARAAILCALLDGRARTAGELASIAGVTAATASAHLGRLIAGGLLAVEKQGRHRYHRLARPEVADALEALLALAPVARPRRLPGPREATLRWCRSCYDHLAGGAAVAMADGLRARGWLVEGETEFAPGPGAAEGFAALGLDLPALAQGRRRLAPRCLDWSERRAHVGGALGAAILTRMEAGGWLRRAADSRAAEITPAGAAAVAAWIGVPLAAAPADLPAGRRLREGAPTC